MLEANPRASRTVPFVSKATGVPLVEAACRVALGDRIAELGLRETTPTVVSVKEAVLPFARFPGADALLGPEMRSTGEVMGIGPDFATAFAKASRAAGQPLPGPRPDRQTSVAITVNDRDKPAATLLAQRFHDIGFRIYATGGTARAIRRLGTPVDEVAKVHAPGIATIPELITSGEVDLVVNTPLGRGARGDGYEIRRAARRPRCRASRRCPAPAPPCRRWRGPGRSTRSRCRSCTWVRRSTRARRRDGDVRLRHRPRLRRGRQLHGDRARRRRGRRPAGHVRDGARPGRRGLPAAPGRAVPSSPTARRRSSSTRRTPSARWRGRRRSTCCRRSARGFDLAGARAESTLLVGAASAPPSSSGSRRRWASRCGWSAGSAGSAQAAMLELIAPAGFREVALAPRLVTELVDLTDIELVLASGPAAMVRAVAALAAEAGVPCQVALEAPMACGFGACYGCAVELDGALDAALHRGAGRRRRSASCVIDLGGAAARAPGAERVGHARRAVRPRGARRRDARLRRARHEDDHARAARRQPAAADRRGAGRHDQLDRPAGPGHRPVPRRGAAGDGRARRRADRRLGRRLLARRLRAAVERLTEADAVAALELNL